MMMSRVGDDSGLPMSLILLIYQYADDDARARHAVTMPMSASFSGAC